MSLRSGARGAVLRWVHEHPGVWLRRQVATGRAPWRRVLPGRVRRVLELDGEPVSGVRVELGGGPYPTPGYTHVDIERRHPHLEYIAPAWDLPFADGTVDELLAVHVLEHVHPARLHATLLEWRRVLRPGAFAQVHVPDGRALAEAFLSSPPETRWAIGSALLGMDSGPTVSAPEDLDSVANLPDHKMVLDAELLRDALARAGFVRVEDLTGSVGDRHCDAWAPVVPSISVVMRAFA